MSLINRAWLPILNAGLALFLGGALLAPLLAVAGLHGAAAAIYDTYHAVCHQWAFRSFFVLGGQALYSQAELEALAVDPFTFAGSSSLGWKLAICERDLAIYLGALAFGAWYPRKRSTLPALGFVAYGVLILPMALDGFSQLLGWRESTWQLRVATGLLFGLASAWLLYPRFQTAFGPRPPRVAFDPRPAE